MTHASLKYPRILWTRWCFHTYFINVFLFSYPYVLQVSWSNFFPTYFGRYTGGTFQVPLHMLHSGADNHRFGQHFWQVPRVSFVPRRWEKQKILAWILLCESCKLGSDVLRRCSKVWHLSSFVRLKRHRSWLKQSRHNKSIVRWPLLFRLGTSVDSNSSTA